jgi:hypothetical protein
MSEYLAMNPTTHFNRGQATASFKHMRESKTIWTDTHLLHPSIHFYGLSKRIVLRITPNDCIPQEDIRVSKFIKHLTGIRNIPKI